MNFGKKKKIVYIDLDETLVDFKSGVNKCPAEIKEKYKCDEIPGVFSLMDPLPGALDAFKFLSQHFDVYILSTAPWGNPSAWTDKLLWVKKYLGEPAYKRLILTHHKELNRGDYIIDDRTKNGVSEFQGEHIQIGSPQFPDWKSVVDYLMKA